MVIIIKEIGLQSMSVEYKEENSSLCRNCSDISLAMGLHFFHKTYIKMSKITFIKAG